MVTAQALPTVVPPTDSAGTGSTLSIISGSGLATADKQFRYNVKKSRKLNLSCTTPFMYNNSSNHQQTHFKSTEGIWIPDWSGIQRDNTVGIQIPDLSGIQIVKIPNTSYILVQFSNGSLGHMTILNLETGSVLERAKIVQVTHKLDQSIQSLNGISTEFI